MLIFIILIALVVLCAGIKVLSHIVCIDARYALEHQAAVMECLNHPDQTVQAKVSYHTF